MGSDPYGLLLDVIAIGVSLISLGVSAWIAFRINHQQLNLSGKITFADATGDHYDRVCERFTRIQTEIREVVAFAVAIDRKRGIAVSADLTEYVTRSNEIAATVMQLSTELRNLQRNFKLHYNIIGFLPDQNLVAKRKMALEQIAIDANKKLNVPAAIISLAGQTPVGQPVWNKAWEDEVSAWAKGALELHRDVIDARTLVNEEFRAFTQFAASR